MTDRKIPNYPTDSQLHYFRRQIVKGPDRVRGFDGEVVDCAELLACVDIVLGRVPATPWETHEARGRLQRLFDERDRAAERGFIAWIGGREAYHAFEDEHYIPATDELGDEIQGLCDIASARMDADVPRLPTWPAEYWVAIQEHCARVLAAEPGDPEACGALAD